MNITKTSALSGITRTLDIPCTVKQLENWRRGALIQHAMPNLSVDEREFLISGCTSEEFETIFETDAWV